MKPTLLGYLSKEVDAGHRGDVNDHYSPETLAGQQRLVTWQLRGDVVDSNLYTAPAKFGGGGAGVTWLRGNSPIPSFFGTDSLSANHCAGYSGLAQLGNPDPADYS